MLSRRLVVPQANVSFMSGPTAGDIRTTTLPQVPSGWVEMVAMKHN